MQMIITERCPFLFADCNFVRTKAKVRVSPKGWRTVFRRFAECKFSFARRQKCVSAQKAGARSLEDLPTANIVRTKTKVRVSPKGWRTVFGRFAECKDKHYSRNLQTFNSLLLSLFDIYHDIVCKARAKARTLSRYIYRQKQSR